MAKRNVAVAASPGAESAGNGSTPQASPPAGRRPGPLTPEQRANIIYWDATRREALLTLLYAHPGQLTSTQVGQTLAKHPAFQDQAQLIGSGSADVAEKIRVQVHRLGASIKAEVEAARTAGTPIPNYPIPQLKRAGAGPGGGGDLRAILARAAQAAGIALQPAGAGTGQQAQAAQPTPTIPLAHPIGGGLVTAPPFNTGLIPIPQG